MFVHLRTHSEFSVVDGTARISELVAAAVAYSQPAIALTDLTNLFGLIKFYKSARGKGIKPIAGCDVWLTNEQDREKPFRVLLLVQNRQGYLNLCELLSRAWTTNQYKGRAELQRGWLQNQEGLILLSGGVAGDIGQALLAGRADQAQALAQQWAQWFPRSFYIELQRTGPQADERYVQQAMQLAARLDLPVVATHPVQFTRPEDFRMHEARVLLTASCWATKRVRAAFQKTSTCSVPHKWPKNLPMCLQPSPIPSKLRGAAH